LAPKMTKSQASGRALAAMSISSLQDILVFYSSD